MRIDPAPSVPCAIGTLRAATWAAEPDEEPPAVKPGATGLSTVPKARFSLVGKSESSGAFVVPSTMSPAARKRATRVLSVSWTCPRQIGLPL